MNSDSIQVQTGTQQVLHTSAQVLIRIAALNSGASRRAFSVAAVGWQISRVNCVVNQAAVRRQMLLH